MAAGLWSTCFVIPIGSLYGIFTYIYHKGLNGIFLHYPQSPTKLNMEPEDDLQWHD